MPHKQGIVWQKRQWKIENVKNHFLWSFLLKLFWFFHLHTNSEGLACHSWWEDEIAKEFLEEVKIEMENHSTRTHSHLKKIRWNLSVCISAVLFIRHQFLCAVKGWHILFITGLTSKGKAVTHWWMRCLWDLNWSSNWSKLYFHLIIYLAGRRVLLLQERDLLAFFKRDEHLEWDHKVFGSAAWRRLSCLSVALITHFCSCTGIYLPFLPLLLLYYFVQIVSPSALPAFSRSQSLMCQSLQVSFRPSLNCMVKTSWFLPLSFFWPTNLSLLLHVKHCTLNVP